MDVSLSKLLSDLDGFVKKREDGTSLTFKAIKDKEEVRVEGVFKGRVLKWKGRERGGSERIVDTS